MSTGLLDFFVLEGSEYVEQLDALLTRAPSGTPDFDAFARNARALRGSATMAKVRGIADVANALERIARGLRDGGLDWTPRLRGAIVASIDDLRILMRGVRAWGSAEDARAAARTTELAGHAPALPRLATRPTVAAAGSSAFLAQHTGDVAAGLLSFADAPGPPASFAATLALIRALRGVAALADLPPLAEVVAGVDEAAKRLELGTTTATDTLRELFRAGAAVLREGSAAMRTGGRPDPTTDAVLVFAAAAHAFSVGAGDDDHVVPIQTLFPDDGADPVVHAEPNPPTTPAVRFRLEVVSQAEHLRRLVADARRAADAPTRQRVAHELRGAIRALSRSAASFGESVVAESLNALSAGAASLDPVTLTGLDEAAALLASHAEEPLAPQMAAIAARVTPARAATPVRDATPVAATPVAVTPVAATPVATAPAAPTPAPSGAALLDMLGAGISGLAALDDTPLAEPTELEDDGIVPIQDLLYRGRAALRRAAQLGQTFRSAAPSPGDLDELYDLLELAEAE